MGKLDLEALRRQPQTPHYFAPLTAAAAYVTGSSLCEHREHGPRSRACGLPAEDPIHLPPRAPNEPGEGPATVG